MLRVSLNKAVYLIFIIIWLSILPTSANALINIVAAENIYGEVTKALGGPYVNVVSILSNPSQDPHLFTTTPSTAKAISLADIVIYNGADYDPWMTSILSVAGQKKRTVINVAALMDIKRGENPHIWYLPATIPTFAKELVSILLKMDPQHAPYYENQLRQFNRSYQKVFAKIEELKKRFQNTPVIATEPVYGYMAKSIGLIMHGKGFQLNVMNDVPPSIAQVKAFEDDLTHHNVRLLIYNKQVINPLTEHMRKLAKEEKIPVLGISEMIPPDLTFTQWMLSELNELEKVLKQHQGN